MLMLMSFFGSLLLLSPHAKLTAVGTLDLVFIVPPFNNALTAPVVAVRNLLSTTYGWLSKLWSLFGSLI